MTTSFSDWKGSLIIGLILVIVIQECKLSSRKQEILYWKGKTEYWSGSSDYWKERAGGMGIPQHEDEGGMSAFESREKDSGRG